VKQVKQSETVKHNLWNSVTKSETSGETKLKNKNKRLKAF